MLLNVVLTLVFFKTWFFNLFNRSILRCLGEFQRCSIWYRNFCYASILTIDCFFCSKDHCRNHVGVLVSYSSFQFSQQLLLYSVNVSFWHQFTWCEKQRFKFEKNKTIFNQYFPTLDCGLLSWLSITIFTIASIDIFYIGDIFPFN